MTAQFVRVVLSLTAAGLIAGCSSTVAGSTPYQPSVSKPHPAQRSGLLPHALYSISITNLSKYRPLHEIVQTASCMYASPPHLILKPDEKWQGHVDTKASGSCFFEASRFVLQLTREADGVVTGYAVIECTKSLHHGDWKLRELDHRGDIQLGWNPNLPRIEIVVGGF